MTVDNGESTIVGHRRTEGNSGERLSGDPTSASAVSTRDASTKPNVHRIAVQLQNRRWVLLIGSVLFSFMVDGCPG